MTNNLNRESEGPYYDQEKLILLTKRSQGSNVPTNPITITRIFPHWPMEQI